MATIKIFEMTNVGNDGKSLIRRAPFAAQQSPGTISATSTQSAAFGPATRIVTIQSDTDCYVRFGKDPTATTGTDFFIQAFIDYDWGVEPGDKVAWVS